MLNRHNQFMSNILFFLCCLFKSYLCIQFKNKHWNDQEDIKADNSNQLRNDAGRSGRAWLARKKCLASIVGLVPHLKFQSALIFVTFSALFSTFNKSALIFVSAEKLSALISFMLQKWVGLNVLGESALIFLALVTSLSSGWVGIGWFR